MNTKPSSVACPGRGSILFHQGARAGARRRKDVPRRRIGEERPGSRGGEAVGREVGGESGGNAGASRARGSTTSPSGSAGAPPALGWCAARRDGDVTHFIPPDQRVAPAPGRTGELRRRGVELPEEIRTHKGLLSFCSQVTPSQARLLIGAESGPGVGRSSGSSGVRSAWLRSAARGFLGAPPRGQRTRSGRTQDPSF